jgi:hypothetical protein
MNIPPERYTPASKVVRVALTPGQVEQLAPLAIKAGLERKNVLFVTSVVPSWSTEKGQTVWELQVVTVSAPIGSKIVRLIRSALNPPPDKPDTANARARGSQVSDGRCLADSGRPRC